jgi:hypothetical protein
MKNVLTKQEREAVHLFKTSSFNTGKYEDRYDTAGCVLAAAVERLEKMLQTRVASRQKRPVRKAAR